MVIIYVAISDTFHTSFTITTQEHTILKSSLHISCAALIKHGHLLLFLHTVTHAKQEKSSNEWLRGNNCLVHFVCVKWEMKNILNSVNNVNHVWGHSVFLLTASQHRTKRHSLLSAEWIEREQRKWAGKQPNWTASKVIIINSLLKILN